MGSPSLDDFTKAEYKAGFVTDIEQETFPPASPRTSCASSRRRRASPTG